MQNPTDILTDLIRKVVREELASAEKANAPTEWMSIKDAAAFVGVTPTTIRRWTRVGILDAHRQGRVIRVKREDVQAALEKPRCIRRPLAPEGSTPEQLAILNFGTPNRRR